MVNISTTRRSPSREQGVRGVLPRVLRTSSSSGQAAGRSAAAAVVAGLRLHHRSQRLHRHQQPRHQRRPTRSSSSARRHQRLRGRDRRPRREDRPGAAQGRSRQAAAPRSAGALRRSRIGDWVIAIGNPLGPGRHRHRRHRLRAPARHQRRPLRRLHPDRRADQPRQFRRPHVQHGRRRDRREHGDLIRRTAVRSASASPIPSPTWPPTSIDQLKDGGTVRRGWLGVRIQTVTDELAEGLRLDRCARRAGRPRHRRTARRPAGIKPATSSCVQRREVEDMRKLPRDGRRDRRSARRSRSRSGASGDGFSPTIDVTLGELDDTQVARRSRPPSRFGGKTMPPRSSPRPGPGGITPELRQRFQLDDKTPRAWSSPRSTRPPMPRKGPAPRRRHRRGRPGGGLEPPRPPQRVEKARGRGLPQVGHFCWSFARATSSGVAVPIGDPVREDPASADGHPEGRASVFSSRLAVALQVEQRGQVAVVDPDPRVAALARLGAVRDAHAGGRRSCPGRWRRRRRQRLGRRPRLGARISSARVVSRAWPRGPRIGSSDPAGQAAVLDHQAVGHGPRRNRSSSRTMSAEKVKPPETSAQSAPPACAWSAPARARPAYSRPPHWPRRCPRRPGQQAAALAQRVAKSELAVHRAAR